jgi:hypothetical protein
LTNICVIELSSKYYLTARQSGVSQIKMIYIGNSKYSYRVKYVTADEEVYVQRTEAGKDSTDTFKVDGQTIFSAESLTAHLHAEEDYSDMIDELGVRSYSFYPYNTDWVTTTDSEYEVSVCVRRLRALLHPNPGQALRHGDLRGVR